MHATQQLLKNGFKMTWIIYSGFIWTVRENAFIIIGVPYHFRQPGKSISINPTQQKLFNKLKQN